MLLVDFDTWERRDFGTSGNDDVLCLDLGLATIIELDIDAGGRCKGASTLDVVDLVLLEETFDTFCEAGNGLFLLLHHLTKVELQFLDVNTTVLELVSSGMVELRVVKE